MSKLSTFQRTQQDALARDLTDKLHHAPRAEIRNQNPDPPQRMQANAKQIRNNNAQISKRSVPAVSEQF
jgi:hypothetical protein